MQDVQCVRHSGEDICCNVNVVIGTTYLSLTTVGIFMFSLVVRVADDI